MESQPIALVFDGSFDGFLTIIHGHFYKKWRPVDIVHADGFQQMLGTNYVSVETDFTQATTVADAIKKKVSPSAFQTAYTAFLSRDPAKNMHLYHYMVLGFSVGRAVDAHTHNNHVLSVHKLAKGVGSEAHKIIEFIRFIETKTGILFATISPTHHVLPLIAEHFTNRLISLPWVIHDCGRGLALLYDTKTCHLAQTPSTATFEPSEAEQHYQTLWTTFFNTIAIDGRRNKKLQRQLMPLKYRAHMTEGGC